MKRHNKSNLPLILLAFVILFLIGILDTGGCSMGAKKSFLVTQKTFNDMVTDYRAYYKSVPSDEQMDLKKNVHPKVIEALKLLTGINEAIRLGIDPSKIDKERFRELRYELYKKLPKIFEKEG